MHVFEIYLTKLLHLLTELLAIVAERTLEEMAACCLGHTLYTAPG